MLVALTGCGPLWFAANMVEAEAHVDEAGAKNAQSHAPFEYYSAAEYLDKAQELAIDGYYEDAIRFARTSTEYARRAIRLSEGGRAGIRE